MVFIIVLSTFSLFGLQTYTVPASGDTLANINSPESLATLSSTYTVPPQPGAILLLDDGGQPGQEGKAALDAFGYTYTQVSPLEFATVDLSGFDVIFVAWIPSQAEIDALNARKTDLANWISSGGGMVVNAEFKGDLGVTNPYSFLPATFDTASPDFQHVNGVHIVDPTHPLASGLTDDLLSPWGNSVHGRITTWPSGATVVTVATEWNSPQVLAMEYGTGKIVVAASDPEYHVLYGPGYGPWQLLYNELKWACRSVRVEIIKPEAGSIWWIEAEPEPKMPTINCQAKVVGITPDPTATTEFLWEADIAYTDHGRSDTHKFASGTTIGGAWALDFKNVIAGGNLTIKVKAVIDNGEYQDSVIAKIRGRNPAKETVKATLGELILQVICFKESSWHQFLSSGLPNFGPPAGFGLMQIDTPPATSEQIWSWLKNVQGGKDVWRGKVAASKSHVKNVQAANADQHVPNLSPEQREQESAYLYRGGNFVGGEFQYYYRWNRAVKQWEVNPLANAGSKAYADDAMNIKAAVLAGNPPWGW
jgi:hypothetical protein